MQGKAKKDLHAIYQAEERETAEQAFDRFLEKYGTKHDKAAACLIKDREVLFAFYDFSAEHWKHLRISNPIESTFATVRLRSDKTKGCLSRDTALPMVFKLAKSAERHWRKFDGANRFGQLIEGVKFRNGEPIPDAEDKAAARPHTPRLTIAPAGARSLHLPAPGQDACCRAGPRPPPGDLSRE